MKKLFILFLLIVPFYLFSQQETTAQRNARMQWWREAKFGMFIHYGLYSGLGGDLYGYKKIGGSEWIQQITGVDTKRYFDFALPKFKPKEGCTDEWVKLAKQAGCKYVVLTSKHHEGFCLYDTPQTELNSVDLVNRDIVKEFLKSCKDNNMKAGLYHSLIDWNHSDYDWRQADAAKYHYPNDNRTSDLHQNPNQEKYKKYLYAVVDDLLKYDNLDILWWDYSKVGFDGDLAWGAKDIIKNVKTKKPQIIMNNRMYGSTNLSGPLVATDVTKGDFSTPEGHIPDKGIPNADWEVCMTLNYTWGYSKYNHLWRDSKTVIKMLIDTVSKGGNFLLNIGPMEDGSVPKKSIEIFTEVGKWIDTYGESIYSTKSSPFENLDYGRATVKDNKIYLFVYKQPKGKNINLPLKAKENSKIYYLKDKNQTVNFKETENSVNFKLKKLDKIATVICLENFIIN